MSIKRKQLSSYRNRGTPFGEFLAFPEARRLDGTRLSQPLAAKVEDSHEEAAEARVCPLRSGERSREPRSCRSHTFKLSQVSQVSFGLLAEREGFEPSVQFPVHTLSKRAPSTTRTSLRVCRINRLRASG